MKQAKSKQVKCEICGKSFAARGIKSHMRLLHQLKVTEQIKQIVQKTYEPIKEPTKVENGGNLSKHSSTQVEKDLTTQVRPTDEQMKINMKQADSFRKWYVRYANGDTMDKEFQTEAEALAQIKKNSRKTCYYCGNKFDEPGPFHSNFNNCCSMDCSKKLSEKMGQGGKTL